MLDQDRRSSQDIRDSSLDYPHSYSSSSNLQTRPFIYSDKHHSSSALSPFAQFLKEDDERFFATFPDAARAAQQQQHQWSQQTLGSAYGDFYMSTAFLPYDGSRSFASSTMSEPPPTVIDAPYTHDAAYSNDTVPCTYPLDVGSMPPYAYTNHVSPDAVSSHDFSAAFYGPMQNQMAQISIDNTNPRPDHQFQESSPISPVHSSVQFLSPVHPIGNDPPPMDYLPSPESTDTVYSPLDEGHQLYPVSPEYMTSASPETPTLPPYPIVPSSGSPDPLMPSRELSLTSQSLPDSEPSPSEPPDVLGESSSSPEGTHPKIPIRRRRPRNRPTDFSGASTSDGRSYMYKIPLQKPATSPAPKPPKPRATAAPGEKKSLALACFFCRGRKIACGPQDPSSPDRTCNQCHRRSLKCEYPTESRRGMRKRKSNIPSDSDFEAHGPKVPIPSVSKD